MHDAALVINSAVACVALLLPISLHIRARNYPMIFNVIWLLLFNLNIFINFTHWWDSYADNMPGFCDISVKLSVGMSTGLSASSLCINRRLVFIAIPPEITKSALRRRLAVIFDILLCVLLPMIVMALSYITQTQRYSILEGQGCITSYWPSVATIFILNGIPVIVELISVGFGTIAIIAFLSRRLHFSSILRSSRSGITTGQYLRLIGMATADLLLALPLNIAYIVDNSSHVVAWTSSKDVHSSFNSVYKLPIEAFDLVYSTYRSASLVLLSYWLGPLLAYIFFVIFGASDEAIREYQSWWNLVSARVLKRGGKDNHLYDPPRLGTAIQSLDSLNWQSYSGKDIEGELGFSSLQIVPKLDHSNMGLSISVQIERSII